MPISPNYPSRRGRIARGLAALCAVSIGALVLSACNAPAVANGSASLPMGQQLAAGQQLVNGSFALSMQTDGDLVEYEQAGANEIPVWATNTSVGAGGAFYLEGNGNASVWSASNDLAWQTNTVVPASSLQSASFDLEADGALELLQNGAVAWSTPAPAPTGTSSDTASNPVLSQYESTGMAVSRDAGVSVALPNGNALWVFGDTTIYAPSGNGGPLTLAAFVPGSSAAEAPYSAGQFPTDLDEVADVGQPLALSPSTAPSTFLPLPTDLMVPGTTTPCTGAAGRSARWVTGAAVLPNSDDVLITYDDACVQGSWDFTVEGWGFEEYNWSTNAIDVGPDDVFPPAADGVALPDQISSLGSPVVNGDTVSVFSSQCTDLYGACSAGVVQEATFPATTADLANPTSYSPLVDATTNGALQFTPMGISVEGYPGVPYQMIEETSVGGTYDIFSSTTPNGPWQLETSGTAPGCGALTLGFCYALEGHPELSTATQIAMSYYDPQAGPLGPDGPIGHIVSTFVPVTS